MSEHVIDAFRKPLRVRPGCQHLLACGCQTPYWLRLSSPAEQAHEAKILGNAKPQYEDEAA